MDETRQSRVMASRFEEHFERRRKAVEEWNRRLDDGTMNPSWARKAWWKTWHWTTGFGSADGRRA